MAGPIGSGTLNDLVRRLDWNRNNTVDAQEGRVVGWVGNNNGLAGTLELGDALSQGTAAVADFRLSKPDADAIADQLSRGDAWVSKEDAFISDGARARIDGFGGAADGKVSRTELSNALQQPGLAVNRDGIFLSSEISFHLQPGRPTPPPVSRPTPPPVSRPTPPPVGRPTPPPVDRPVPPPVDRPVPPPVDRPVPPPVTTYVAPSQIVSDYERRRADLSQIYNSTSMGQTEYNDRQYALVNDAVQQLISQTGDRPYGERKAALSRLYNDSPMSQAQYNQFEQQLVSQAVRGLIVGTRGESYGQRKAELSQLYNQSSMTQAEYDAHERELLADAVDQLIIGTRGQSFGPRKAGLDQLYNQSSMTQGERDGYEHQLVQDELQRIYAQPISVSEKINLINQLYNASSMTQAERDDAMRQLGY